MSGPLDGSRLPLDLPSATTRIHPFQNWLFRDAIGATPSYTEVHEGYGYVACAHGSAVSLTQLLALAGCRPEDGPMLVRSRVEVTGRLEVEREYVVGGQVLSLEPRAGRKLGLFDELMHEWTLSPPGGSPVYRYVGTLALPRRSAP